MKGVNIVKLYSLLLCLFVSLNSFAQREVIIKRSLIITCENQSYGMRTCDYSLMVPTDKPGKQQVIEYKYGPISPKNVTKTASNEYYLQWKKVSFAELEKAKLEVNIKLKIKPYDLGTAKEKPALDPADMDTLSYLRSEENFNINAKNIKEAASKIEGGAREEIAKKIFYFVTEKLEYKIFFFQDRGAKKALKDGQGDCTEYSELMITLCRAKGIPARIIKGLTLHTDGSVGHHNWVELFFPQYGWVQFDPTWADGPNANTTFYKMKNCYVQLSTRRFINSKLTPCSMSEIPYTLELKDSYSEIAKDPSNNLYSQMRKQYDGGNQSQAMELLDSLIKLEPDNYLFWCHKGVLNARMGNFDTALKCCNKATDLSINWQNKTTVIYALSKCYALNNDANNTIKYLREAIELSTLIKPQILRDPDFDRIKNDPIFVEFLKEIKLDHK